MLLNTIIVRTSKLLFRIFFILYMFWAIKAIAMHVALFKINLTSKITNLHKVWAILSSSSSSVHFVLVL